MKQRRKLISFNNRKDEEKKKKKVKILNSKRTKVCIINPAEESTSADPTSAMISSELLNKVIQVKHYLQRFLTLMNLFCFEAHSS